MTQNHRVAVLVVEDEPLIRMCALDMVEALGFEALSASGADDAIAILGCRSDIRIVFTDIHMAGTMDGLALAAYVRGKWPPIQFIVVSGEKNPLVSDMPAGALSFPKPYHAQAIGTPLQKLVGIAL